MDPSDEPRSKSCNIIECLLLGHCYAKHGYKEFYCDCFEGYSGADCGVGPLCPKTPHMCKNGGTCGQMGPAAVCCIFAPGFTGDLCEAQIEAPVYIKQDGQVESRGSVGILESLSKISPVTSYWRVPGLEIPSRVHRRQSTPDTRVDIVRCVEYKDSLLSSCDVNVGGQHLGDSHMGTSHVNATYAVCDLVAHSHTMPQRSEYMAHVYLELEILETPSEPATPLLTCSIDFKPYTGRHLDTSKDGYNICAHSNPDVSKITSPPIKSCLKKPKPDFNSCISLLSIELKKESKSTSDIEQVNRVE